MAETKARPTQFLGTMFRSKAEARVALLLQELGYHWMYEPWFLKLDDGYVPDFLFFEFEPKDPLDEFSGHSKNNFDFTPYIVEYKPQMPTKAYMDEIGKRFSLCLRSMLKWFPWWCACEYDTRGVLIAGGMGYEKATSSQFDPCLDSDGVVTQCGWDEWEEGWGLTHKISTLDIDATNEANKDYRFDLRNPKHDFVFKRNDDVVTWIL